MKVTIAGIIKDPGSSVRNKTGDWRTFKPILNESLCIACGNCHNFCPDGSVNPKDDLYEIDYDHCKGCGICANECPVDAIEMVKEEK